jgi:hypothetical protein
MEVNGQLHAPAALSQEKSLRYPLDRRLGGSRSLSGRGNEEKNSQPPPRIKLKNPERPARSPIAINKQSPYNLTSHIDVTHFLFTYPPLYAQRFWCIFIFCYLETKQLHHIGYGIVPIHEIHPEHGNIDVCRSIGMISKNGKTGTRKTNAVSGNTNRYFWMAGMVACYCIHTNISLQGNLMFPRNFIRFVYRKFVVGLCFYPITAKEGTSNRNEMSTVRDPKIHVQ